MKKINFQNIQGAKILDRNDLTSISGGISLEDSISGGNKTCGDACDSHSQCTDRFCPWCNMHELGNVCATSA